MTAKKVQKGLAKIEVVMCCFSVQCYLHKHDFNGRVIRKKLFRVREGLVVGDPGVMLINVS